MNRHSYLIIITSLSFFLSALTIPMSFLAQVIDVSYDYDTLISAVIRSIWNWGPDLTQDTKLPEPLVEVLMHGLNFCLFFMVLFSIYYGCRLTHKLRCASSPNGAN
jgi:hypothetical protein